MTVSANNNTHDTSKSAEIIIDAAMHEAVPAIAALGVSPIVRVPDFQGWMVKRE